MDGGPGLLCLGFFSEELQVVAGTEKDAAQSAGGSPCGKGSATPGLGEGAGQPSQCSHRCHLHSG